MIRLSLTKASPRAVSPRRRLLPSALLLAGLAFLALAGSASPARAQGVDVVWKQVVGATANGNTLTKTGAVTEWDAGAISAKSIASGSGYVEFVAPATTATGSWMCGLSHGNTDTGYQDIDYALLMSASGVAAVYEAGVSRGSFPNYAAGDIYRVSVSDGVVEYWKNGVVFYSSATAASYPLLVDAAIKQPGGVIASARMGGNLGTNQLPVASAGGPYLAVVGQPVAFDGSGSSDADGAVVSYAWDFGDGSTGTGPTPSHAYGELGTYTAQLTVTDDSGGASSATASVTVAAALPVVDVVWKQVVGATANGNTLTKTGAVTEWDAGAISAKSIASGSGYVEFVAPATTATGSWMCGLSHGNTDTGYQDVDYALLMSASGAVAVYEAGVSRGSFPNYAAGDVYRVSVSDGVVQYWKNGVVFYSSATAASYPLLVDAAIKQPGGVIASARMGGNLGTNQLPVASAGGPYLAVVGQAVAFDGSGSSDADGAVVGYAWDFGDGTTGTGATPSHAYGELGTHTAQLTVTDDSGGTSSATASVTVTAALPVVDVVWKQLVGVAANGNSLTKTGTATAWDAGAASAKSIVSGSGYVEFTATEVNRARMCGLSGGNSDAGYADIDYAVYPTASGVVQVYENGLLRGSFGNYAAGDTLRVSVSAGVVRYWRNGVAFYTSTVAPTYPLLVDSSIYTPGGTITNATMWGNSGPNQPPVASAGGPYVEAVNEPVWFDGSGSSDADGAVVSYAWDFGDGGTGTGATASHAYGELGTYTAQLTVTDDSGGTSSATASVTVTTALPVVDVVWKQVVGATANGNTLTKTGTVTEWDAGAISAKSIVSGSGYVEFVAPATTATGSWMCGLSHGNTDTGYQDVDYGLLMSASGGVAVYEAGVSRGSFPNYAAGDVYRVSVSGGVVQYSKNGAVFYSSATAASYPLLVDAAIKQPGGVIANARMGGNLGTNQRPVASAGGPYWGEVGAAVVLDARASDDPDGELVSYAWDFGDGATGTGATASHVYTSLGSYTVHLTVTDESGDSSSTSQQVDVVTPTDVVWKQVVGVTANGNTLTKTGAVTEWDAGAISGKSIVSGSGYVEFVAPATTAIGSWMCGLSHGNTDTGYQDVDYALLMSASGAVAVYEAGVSRGSFPNYAAGDVYRVSVSGGVVQYWKNGLVFYSSATAASYPLLVDAAIKQPGGVITNARMFGDFGPNRLPVANAGGPYVVAPGQAVAFDGRGSDDPDGAVLGYVWDFGDGSTGTGPTPSHQYASLGTYVAQLIVTDNEGASSTATTAEVAAVPAVPTPISPIGAAGTVTPTFQWTASDGAYDYLLQVENATGSTKQRTANVNPGCSAGTCSLVWESYAAGAYKWRVQARDAGGSGLWSAKTAFTIPAPPATAPVLVSPGGILGNRTPAFVWRPSGASTYALGVDNTDAQRAVVRASYQASSICTAVMCAVNPGTALAAGHYNWHVQGGSATSPLLSFEIRKVPLPQGDPSKAEEVRFYHLDPLGSVRMVTDKDGSVVARYDYFPFGEQIPSGLSGRANDPAYAQDAGNKRRFTGQYRDFEGAALPLDYFGARYYSGAQGRFMSPDAPFADQHIGDPQSWNLYAYVRNRPLNHLDSDGREMQPTGDPADELAPWQEELGPTLSALVSIQDGKMQFQATKEQVAGNFSAATLLEAVNSPVVMTTYVGGDMSKAALLFEAGNQGSLNYFNWKDRNGTTVDTGGGLVVGTKGRTATPQPSGGAFAAVAMNPNWSATDMATGRPVTRGRLLAHEIAENLEFERMSAAGRPLDRDAYKAAHAAVTDREKQAPESAGAGFAGNPLERKRKP